MKRAGGNPGLSYFGKCISNAANWQHDFLITLKTGPVSSLFGISMLDLSSKRTIGHQIHKAIEMIRRLH